MWRLSQHLQKCTGKNPKTFGLSNLWIIKLLAFVCIHQNVHETFWAETETRPETHVSQTETFKILSETRSRRCSFETLVETLKLPSLSSVSGASTSYRDVFCDVSYGETHWQWKLWHQHYVTINKEYLINCHILLQYFELVLLQLQMVKILCKLMIIWVNYEKNRKGSLFYETPCSGCCTSSRCSISCCCCCRLSRSEEPCSNRRLEKKHSECF